MSCPPLLCSAFSGGSQGNMAPPQMGVIILGSCSPYSLASCCLQGIYSSGTLLLQESWPLDVPYAPMVTDLPETMSRGLQTASRTPRPCDHNYILLGEHNCRKRNETLPVSGIYEQGIYSHLESVQQKMQDLMLQLLKNGMMLSRECL